MRFATPNYGAGQSKYNHGEQENSMTSKASVRRFFEDHVGAVLTTRQVYPDGATWEPGPRTLTANGRRFFLDGSQVRPDDPGHTVIEQTETSVTIAWIDRDAGMREIHRTTYSEA